MVSRVKGRIMSLLKSSTTKDYYKPTRINNAFRV